VEELKSGKGNDKFKTNTAPKGLEIVAVDFSQRKKERRKTGKNQIKILEPEGA
jgi:hypothetical protein